MVVRLPVPVSGYRPRGSRGPVGVQLDPQRVQGWTLSLGIYVVRPTVPGTLQVYLVKKPVNFGPHFLVNESETR